MNRKISLEEFRNIKSEMAKLIKDYEEQFLSNNDDFDEEELMQQLIEQYCEAQDKLLSYDLSDIPFEEWEGILIFADENHIADFSNTKANIDFNLIEFDGYCNFNGCNIRNLDSVLASVKPSDFDDKTLKENESLFLSDIFSEEFKEKYYSSSLTIEDLAVLSKEQQKEIVDKIQIHNLNSDKISVKLYDLIGIARMIELYNYSKDDYLAIEELVENCKYSMNFFLQYFINNDEMEAELKKCDISQMKALSYDKLRNLLLSSRGVEFGVFNKLPLFKKENKDIFLEDANIPEEVKEKCFKRTLTIEDLINYQDLFSNIQVEYFVNSQIKYVVDVIKERFGSGKFYPLVLKHPDVFRHIEKRQKFYEFSFKLKREATDLEELFIKGVKDYFFELELHDDFRTITAEGTIYNVPDWLSSMNFQFKDKITTIEELKNYKNNMFILEKGQQKLINILGIENIIKLENEIGFFSHKEYEYSKDLEMFEAFSAFLTMYNELRLLQHDIDFKNGTLEYQEFLKEFAKTLNFMRKYNIFTDYPSYDWIRGEFRDNNREIFIDLNAPDVLREAFYKNRITPTFLYKHDEYIPYLLDKDLSNIIRGEINLTVPGLASADGNIIPTFMKFIDEYVSRYGNGEFLQLVSKYGRYLEEIIDDLDKIQVFNDLKQDKDVTYIENIKEYITNVIEETIINKCYLSDLNYNEDAPEFLKKKCPDLFLDKDAPDLLKKYFYNFENRTPLNFINLSKHKDWLQYLKNKSIKTALLKTNVIPYKNSMKKYLELFGEEKGIKLGISRAETVTEMIESNQVDLMKKWYDKTGGKFIPDFVVMQNFSYEEADKFLISGSNWSTLMKNKSFANTPEGRDAMLKLAYSFGVFDQDQRGLKKLQDLLTGLPRQIDSKYDYIFNRLDKEINIYSEREKIFQKNHIDSEDNNESMSREEKERKYKIMLDGLKKRNFVDSYFASTIINLFENIKKEEVNIDFTKNIFSQIYRKNEDGSYTLTLNQQSCPKTFEIVKEMLGASRELPILTPNKAHQLFGGFELKYDADFREFLLANMNEIYENPEQVTFVSKIQKQFSEIKAVNSNRALTWDLAVSYIQTNKYTGVNVGNEKAAEISAIAGYSQSDFDTLQQIYNYGKQRVFSSIPRIEKTSGRYTYEMLRLDDPLAMAIGTLTDCCQELGNCAEVCMEHSMVDKNGRVFVIKDEKGNIVSQSWVWRNKDVLCFDNIEIPDKAFSRAEKESSELGRIGFSDEVYDIYKKAAKELIEADEQVFKELLESGKITQEQYDGLRLGKVTVGLGYNDIAATIRRNSEVDKSVLARPLPFEEPVRLSRGLYTNDSTTQYILEQRDDRKEYVGETLSVHNDIYTEHTDSNFNEKDLLLLGKLEIVTKEEPTYLETSISDYADREKIVTEIAKNYGLNPDATRIIMNPNFAIIYDENDNELRIGDLLFNTKVDNGEQQIDIENIVVMQIRLALEQIKKEKEIDISELNDKQKEMYAKAMGLTDELDIERGVGHAR